MHTPDKTITRQEESLQPNFAKQFLEQQIRPILGEEITNFWVDQSDKWTQRFVQQNLNVMMDRVGQIPQVKATTDKEATPAIKFQLEHWMVAANIHVAGNLTIATSAEILSHTEDPEIVQTMLNTIGGAQARIHWETTHNQTINNLTRIINFRKARGYDTSFQEKQIIQENTRYQSPLNQLNFLQKSQDSYVKTQNRIRKDHPDTFKKDIKKRQEESFSTFNRLTRQVSTVVGRDDRGYFDVDYYLGPWSQLGNVEDPLRPGHEPKGVSVVFYRFNQNGEKEFFTCFGKQDAFARTLHLSPTWQSSYTRIQEGNHPGQDYNPTLDSLKDAFQQASTTNGVEICYLDLNANRNEKSPIAVATINWDSYSEEQKAQILVVLEKENKGLKHAWITEENIIKIGRTGLVDKEGVPSPAINGFLAIAIGRRHPKEIQQDNLNRRTLIEIKRHLADNPGEFGHLEAMAIKLIEQAETRGKGILLQALLQTLLFQVTEHERIELEFPHIPPQLPQAN